MGGANEGDDKLAAAELQVRLAEVSVRRRELAVRRREALSKQALWASPVILTLLAGVVGIFANTATGFLTNKWNRELERDKAEAALILKAIEDRDSLQRISNLAF